MRSWYKANGDSRSSSNKLLYGTVLGLLIIGISLVEGSRRKPEVYSTNEDGKVLRGPYEEEAIADNDPRFDKRKALGIVKKRPPLPRRESQSGIDPDDISSQLSVKGPGVKAPPGFQKPIPKGPGLVRQLRSDVVLDAKNANTPVSPSKVIPKTVGVKERERPKSKADEEDDQGGDDARAGGKKGRPKPKHPLHNRIIGPQESCKSAPKLKCLEAEKAYCCKLKVDYACCSKSDFQVSHKGTDIGDFEQPNELRSDRVRASAAVSNWRLSDLKILLSTFSIIYLSLSFKLSCE